MPDLSTTGILSIAVLAMAAVYLEYLTIRACLRLSGWCWWLLLAADIALPFLGWVGLGGLGCKLWFLWTVAAYEPVRGISRSPRPFQRVRSRGGLRQALLAPAVLAAWGISAAAPMLALLWGTRQAVAAFAWAMVGMAGVIALRYALRHVLEEQRRLARVREPGPWLRGPTSW